MKNYSVGFTSRCNTSKEGMSELEDRSLEIAEILTQRENRWKNIEHTFPELWHYNKWFNVNIIEVWGEGEKTWQKKIFEEIMIKGGQKIWNLSKHGSKLSKLSKLHDWKLDKSYSNF